MQRLVECLRRSSPGAPGPEVATLLYQLFGLELRAPPRTAGEVVAFLRRHGVGDLTLLHEGRPNLASLLMAAAAKSPDAPALVGLRRTVSYAELSAIALGISGKLAAAGIRPGSRVGIALPDGFDQPAVVFGVLACGATAVPMHHGVPDERLARSCVQLGIAALVVTRDRTVPVPAGTISIPVDELMGGPPVACVPPAGPAMILPTSGTTGDSKGVVLSHDALIANALGICATLALSPATRSLGLIPFCFAYGNSVLLSHVAAGASVVVDPMMGMSGQLERCIVECAPTLIPTVPSFLVKLLASGQLSSTRAPSVRRVTIAGGAPARRTLEELAALRPDVVMQVMYGQTEAGARITCMPPARNDKLGCCGVALPGMIVEIAGEGGEPLPSGVEGQVVARGPSLMDGYFRDEEATSVTLRGGALHTGDLGILDGDGFLEITGRISSLLKVDGYRLSPLEVEDVLSEHPAVLESLVTLEEGADGTEALVARVVARGEVAERELMAHCGRLLPRWKVPKRLLIVSDLPRTAGGKVRRTGTRAS